VAVDAQDDVLVDLADEDILAISTVASSETRSPRELDGS